MEQVPFLKVNQFEISLWERPDQFRKDQKFFKVSLSIVLSILLLFFFALQGFLENSGHPLYSLLQANPSHGSWKGKFSPLKPKSGGGFTQVTLAVPAEALAV